jgi:hypothetical protein
MLGMQSEAACVCERPVGGPAMRSTFRVVLSFCVVVLAGCSHATTATPTSDLNGIVQQGSVRSASGPRIRFGRARTGESDTLSVRIEGPSAVKAAGVAQFSAAVENGRANRYYYWWFVASCAKSGKCAPSSYTLVAEGEGRVSVGVPFGAMHAEKDIVVQVAEIDGDGQTGSSAQFAVAGPSPRPGNGREKVSGGICDWFAGSFFPHKGLYTDPYSGRKWERGFRRDYCGNKISWGPQGPQGPQT